MIKANKALILKTLSDAQNNLDKIHHVDDNGFTALFFCEDPAVISFLIKQGLDVNHKSKQGFTPLMFSVRHSYDNYEKMHILISAGADLNTVDEHGQNALFGCNSPVYTEALVDAGIEISSVDKYGENILFNCMHYEAYDSFDYLLEKGVNASPVNELGQNILFHNDLSLNDVKRLIAAGANPHQIDNEGRNVLSRVGSEDIIDFYISLGVDPLKIDQDGNNLFFQKVQHHSEHIFPVIGKLGIDINARNNKGHNLIQHLFIDIDDYIYIINSIRPYYQKKINSWISLGFIIDAETQALIDSKLNA